MRMRGSVRVLLLCLIAGIGIILISWLLKDNSFIMVEDTHHSKMVTPIMQSLHAIETNLHSNKDSSMREMFPLRNKWNPINGNIREKNEVIQKPPVESKFGNFPSANKTYDQMIKPQSYLSQFSDNDVSKNVDANFQQGNSRDSNNNIIAKIQDIPHLNINNQNPWQNMDTPFQKLLTPTNLLVHLDLKGAPPKLSYLKEFFPLIRSLGATGLLIEYEDMFPYWGPLKKLSAKNAYSSKEIALINKFAMNNKLIVIPLIQTFGHLEFLLKLKDFKHLREVYKYPQSICPSHNQTMSVLQTIIDQVMQLHPKINWLHLGCDEVHHLGLCEKCVSHMARESIDLNMLFIQHMMRVADYVKVNYKVQPIVWDDMFREMPFEILNKSDLGKFVQPMIWNYAQYVPEALPFDIWDKYSRIFPYVWAASAFKGASGPFQYITNIRNHLDNHLSWLTVWNNEHSKFKNFYGLALTGWQRFDHFAVLCELLPVGLPSLAVNLLTMAYGFFNNDILSKASKALNYSNDYLINMDITSDLSEEVPACSFLGSDVFKGTKIFHSYRKSFDLSLKNSHLIGWMSAYNIKKNFSSPSHIEIGQKEYPRLIHNLTSLRTFMQNALREVYDEFTVKEWIETFITPLLNDLKHLLSSGQKLINIDSWPRRPI